MPAAMVENETKYKRGTRVVVTEDIRGVPEGTPGNVRIPVGVTWLRYRVKFDNGADVGTVGHEKLVPEHEWANFKANRAQIEAEAAEAAKREAEEAKAAPAAKAPADGGGDDRLAAMLARSKAAKAAKTGAAPEQPPSTQAETPADSGGGDDRLAAMLARSKAAKEAKGL